MTLTITDAAMTSDQTAHTARLAPGSEHLWEVSWLPGRALDRNSAITAMTLAGHAGQGDLNEQHQIWPFIQGWAAELGLTGSDAITVHAQEREAHLREVQLHAQDLPDGSYGRRNRQAIADRETRITTRLRAVEHAYQTAIERDVIPELPEPNEVRRFPDHVPDKEIDLG